MYIATLKEALDDRDCLIMDLQNTAPIRVFIVHRHRTILWGLERLVESAKPAMEVIGTALSLANALERLPAATADVILLDMGVCSEHGVDCIRNIPLVS